MSASGAIATRTLLGTAAPGLCVLHCLAPPALIAVTPGITGVPLAEPILIDASLIVGVAIARRGVGVHGERRLWILIVVALGLFTWTLAGGLTGTAERIVTGLGSLAVLATVVWDARLRRRCTCESCGCAAVARGAGRPGSAINDMIREGAHVPD